MSLQPNYQMILALVLLKTRCVLLNRSFHCDIGLTFRAQMFFPRMLFEFYWAEISTASFSNSNRQTNLEAI